MTEQLTEPVETHDEDLFDGPLPAWPKWIGGLALAWGGLGVTCFGFAGAVLPFRSKFIEPILDGAPMPEALSPIWTDWVNFGIGTLFAFVLLFGGIFCISRRPISRLLIIAWAVVTIPRSMFSYIRQMEVQESLVEWAQLYPDTQYGKQINSTGGVTEIVTLVFTIVIGILIPVLFLLWFGLIKTNPEQMTGSEDPII